jgi:hypothetical protein
MTDKPPGSGQDRMATADYIADLTGKLAQMARDHGLSTLGYLLDMARLEAENAKSIDGQSQ